MILRTVDRRKEAQKRGPYGRGLAFVFLAALSWGGIVPPAHAQPPDSSRAMPKVDRVKQAQELAAYRAGVGNARKLAMANNVAGAEQALTAVNKSKPNTASWHMETAQRLMQTAEYLRREAKPAAVPALAASALNHLTQADGLTKDVRDRAAAKCLVGFIQERFLANRTAALAAYQAAAQISPESARAKAAVARLQQAESRLKAKSMGGQR